MAAVAGLGVDLVDGLRVAVRTRRPPAPARQRSPCSSRYVSRRSPVTDIGEARVLVATRSFRWLILPPSLVRSTARQPRLVCPRGPRASFACSSAILGLQESSTRTHGVAEMRHCSLSSDSWLPHGGSQPPSAMTVSPSRQQLGDDGGPPPAGRRLDFHPQPSRAAICSRRRRRGSARCRPPRVALLAVAVLDGGHDVVMLLPASLSSRKSLNTCHREAGGVQVGQHGRPGRGRPRRVRGHL